jgi:hypothetical protein
MTVGILFYGKFILWDRKLHNFVEFLCEKDNIATRQLIPIFLSLLCLLNAVEDMFSTCIVQWCKYPSSSRFNEDV